MVLPQFEKQTRRLALSTPSFPINLNLQGRRAFLAGAGRVGFRKLLKLLSAGARVRVLEKEPSGRLCALAEAGRVELYLNFQDELLDGVFLVLVATSDAAFNQILAAKAQVLGLLLNVADDPAISNFTMPAVIANDPLMITLSTGGQSPALSAHLAGELKARYGQKSYALLARTLGLLRPLILKTVAASEREDVFCRLAQDSDLLAALASNKGSEILAQIKKITSVDLPKDFLTQLEEAEN